MQLDVTPLSYKGQWQKNALTHSDNKFENTSIQDVSYVIMNDFVTKIQLEKRWKNWKPAIEKELKIPCDKEWTLQLFGKAMTDRGFRLRNLDNMAGKMGDSSVRKCFYTESQAIDIELEQARISANNDQSMGFLGDISECTLREISALISADPSWKLMGDGLGFNFSKINDFKDPYEMLSAWVKIFPQGTLKRISFEVEKIKLTKVGEYLNAIPLIKFAEIEIGDAHVNYPEGRMTTIFDMERLEEIFLANDDQLDWVPIVGKFKYKKTSDIWLSGDIDLGKLQGAFKSISKAHAQYCNQFIQEVKSGRFEPKSLQGVTYNQIRYLAGTQKIRDNQMVALSKRLSPCDVRRANISLDQFFSIYWQMNEDCDLSILVKKMDQIVYQHVFCGSCSLEERCNEMIPKRYYSPGLAKENMKKKETV